MDEVGIGMFCGQLVTLHLHLLVPNSVVQPSDITVGALIIFLHVALTLLCEIAELLMELILDTRRGGIGLFGGRATGISWRDRRGNTAGRPNGVWGTRVGCLLLAIEGGATIPRWCPDFSSSFG